MMKSTRTPASGTVLPAARWAVAGGLCGLIAALVLFAPAAWLAAALASGSSERIWLADAQGTVWNGSARLVLAGGEGSRDALALPGELSWRLRPGISGLRAEIDLSCCAALPMVLRATPIWGGMQVSAQALRVEWPAALLSGLGTPWNTLQLDGSLRFDTEGLSARWVQGRLILDGSAQLDAQRISSRLSTLRPMGSYRITLFGGNPSTLVLQTLDGSLQMSGRGEWVGDRLRFRGEASAEADREAALSNLLNLIGRRQGARSIISIG